MIPVLFMEIGSVYSMIVLFTPILLVFIIYFVNNKLGKLAEFYE